MKTSRLTSLVAGLILLPTMHVAAQVNVAADQTATIEAGGLNGTNQLYAQFAGGGFDEYSLAEFSISQTDFGGQTLTALNSVDLRLTVNDRTFSQTGTFTIFFTTDTAADLTTTTDYDALAFDSTSNYGINLNEFTYDPVAVGTGTYPVENVGGVEVTVSIDLTTIGTDLLNAINAGENVHFVMGASQTADSGGVTATFSGVGNTFDPGDPTLIIDATTSGALPEPTAHPTSFAISPEVATLEATWTDSSDAVGYLVLISDTNSFTAPTDGVVPVEDLDLSDGSGAQLVAQGTQTASFTGLPHETEFFFTIYPYTNADAEIDYKTDGTPATASATTLASAAGNILITQYYEGSSSNKYIELTNVTGASIDMNNYILTSWSNTTTEDWKTSGNSTSRTTVFTGVTIAAGATIIVADPNAASPIPVGDADVSNGQSTFFNGNDSVVLYANSAQDPLTIVDAIPFTDSGNEGANTGFVRLSTLPGYDLTAGTNVLSFPSVWQETTTETADNGVTGEDAFLGSSDLGNPPPEVFFTESSIIVSEDGVSATLTVEIQDPDGNAVDVDVVFDSINSTAEGADIDNYSTQTVSFGAGASSGDQETVTVTLTDDLTEEVSESAIFTLENIVTTGTTIVGSVDAATITIQDDDTVIPNLLISEIVDPSDNAGSGRYVELYNPTGSEVDLAAGNWNLVVYFNANSSGNDIPLTGTIAAGGTYIIAQSDTFDTVYSVADEDVSSSSINSNGDDNFELRFGGDQNTGVLVDVYGQPGTDGTGEAWEFADSRAVRAASITAPNSTWTSSEWIILPSTVSSASPRVHPETIILVPTDVSATATGSEMISIAFTAVDSNDVVIVFNETGTFTEPTGSTPSVGQSFAGGTVLYQGQSSPQVHNGLSEATQYFYSVFSVNGTDYSITTEVDATTEVAGLIAGEDFNSDPDAWFNATISGGDAWDLTGVDAFIDAGSNDDGIDEHFLISPELDLSAFTGVTIAFDYAGSYDNDTNVENLTLVYSTNYSGDASTATWMPITFDFTNISTVQDNVVVPDDLVSSGAISLAAIEGESAVRLAFRYESPDTTLDSTEQWVVDNIVIQSSSADPLGDYLSSRALLIGDLENDTNSNGFTVLEEYLASFGDGSGTDLIIYDADQSNNAFTLLSDSSTIPDGITVELLATADLTVAMTSVPYTTSVVDNGDGTFTISFIETTPPAGTERFHALRITAN